MAKTSHMSPRAGQGLPRAVIVVWVTLCFSAVLSPAPAQSGGVVVTVGSNYIPGDDSVGAPTLLLVQGTELNYTNLDAFAGHSVTSDLRLSDEFSTPVFDSGVIKFRSSAAVAGTAGLEPGMYGFHCSIHEDNMHGTLTVVGT